MENDELGDLTSEAVLGMTLAILDGINPPRWLCMNEEAKANYAAKGRAAMDAFKSDELAAKAARKNGNPRGFFVR